MNLKPIGSSLIWLNVDLLDTADNHLLAKTRSIAANVEAVSGGLGTDKQEPAAGHYGQPGASGGPRLGQSHRGAQQAAAVAPASGCRYPGYHREAFAGAHQTGSWQLSRC
jgi:hypothetical protein